MRGKILKITLVLTLIVALLLPAAGAFAASPDGASGLQRAIEVKERHVDSLFQTPGIAAVGVGHNWMGRPALIVFTETRGVRGIPASLDGVPVISKYSGTFSASPKPDGKGKPGGGGDKVDPTSRFPRPVPIGVSTGHPDITAGTISARVTDGTNVYALSNNHVYANQNLANKGDAVIQPGAYDGGALPDDYIGTLYDFIPIDFGGPNEVDAAIAQTTTALLDNSTPSDGYGTPKSSIITNIPIGLNVQKYGRTTGQTKGHVDAINVTVNVQYDQGVAQFVNQIIVSPGNFSRGGDSGSLIVARGGPDNRSPVGLLFAGSPQYTVANPIDSVLSALGVTIDGN